MLFLPAPQPPLPSSTLLFFFLILSFLCRSPLSLLLTTRHLECHAMPAGKEGGRESVILHAVATHGITVSGGKGRGACRSRGLFVGVRLRALEISQGWVVLPRGWRVLAYCCATTSYIIHLSKNFIFHQTIIDCSQIFVVISEEGKKEETNE